MHPYHVQWWKKEEEKREQSRNESEIETLNRQFSNLIRKLEHKLDKSKYRDEENRVNRQLVSCSIWKLGYRNNFINPHVLALQAEWLLLILKKEEGEGTIENEQHFKRELSNLIHRIRHVEMSVYSNFIRNHPDANRIL